MLCAGAALSDPPPSADHLIGCVGDEPLAINNPQKARHLIAGLAALQMETRARLDRRERLLTFAPTRDLRAFARTLGDALCAYADGMDVAGVDPDALPPPAAEAFERMGRRSAMLLDLAEELPRGAESPQAEHELLALVELTENDVLEMHRVGRVRHLQGFVPVSDLVKISPKANP
jgi:hypothetical protein